MGYLCPARWPVVLSQDIVDGLMGIAGTRQGCLDLLIGWLKAIPLQEVVGETRNIDIFTLQSCTSQSQVISDIAPHSRQNVRRTYISEESQLGLRHREHSVFSGDPEGRESTDSESSTHDNAVPVSDLQSRYLSELIVQGKLVSEEVKSVLDLRVLVEQRLHVSSRAERFPSRALNPKSLIGRYGWKVGSEVLDHGKVQGIECLWPIEHNLEE